MRAFRFQSLAVAALALAGGLSQAAPTNFIRRDSQVRKDEHKVGIDRDPDVIYLADFLKEPVVLKLDKPAAVFSDKAGNTKLGMLQGNQTVVLEAMTDKAYRVRGKGEANGIAGWVGPKNFTSADPNFVENLKKFYARQQEVTKLIAQEKVAVGMTQDEVTQALGKPTKTTAKQTSAGTSGAWEYITYEDVQHWAYLRDPVTGQAYRQLTGVTREEKNKTTVEFQGGVVSTVEETEQRHGNPGQIIVPPIIFAW